MGRQGASSRKPGGGRGKVGRPRAPEPQAQGEPAVLPEIPLVEIDVDPGPASHWLREVTERWPLGVRIEICRPTGVGGSDLLQVVELLGDPGALGEAERFLRHRTDLKALTVASPSPARRFLRVVTELPDLCRRVFEIGAICASCRFAAPPPSTDARERWTLVVPRNPAALRAAVGPSSGPGRSPLPILRVRRFVPPRTLTPRQAAALETAYRLGFYAFPRRSNLKEVARILGVSRSTTAELLRRAENKMLAHPIPGS